MSISAKIIWQSVGVTLVAVLLVGAVVWGLMMRPMDVPCKSLEYIIEDRAERMYLTEGELTRVLETEGVYPVGKALNRGSLHKIESAIRRHPMVRTAECYLTPWQVMKVRLTQRVPLLRVQTPGDTYFVDTDRRIMPVREAVKDQVLVAKGAVGVQMASGPLVEFAQWLENDNYWKPRVHHVYVQNPRMVYVYLKGAGLQVSGERILLGSMHGFESKLAKCRTFFENGQEALKDKQYKEYDLRFNGQVVAR